MPHQIKQLIEEMIIKKLNEEISDDFEGLTYKKTYSTKYEPDEDDDNVTTSYNILDLSKNKVGEVNHESLVGSFHGHLYNKEFKFDGLGNNPKKNMEAWFKTKSFQKWVANIDKYKALKAPTNDYRLKSNKR